MANNLLVISDLHLGEGLSPTDEVRPDVELCTFVEHYTEVRRSDRPWTLVINGDMVDFMGICLMPSDVGWVTDLHPDSHYYGLGSRAHAAEIKLRTVIARHARVFRALARFVGQGNDLALVVGNHDAEFHWQGVQALFQQAIARTWAGLQEQGRSSSEVFSSISFHPWFFLEEGVAWIEHGHQYDPYCSFEHALDPATDEQDLDANVGDITVRYFVNHYAAHAAEHWGFGFWAYLGWWARQGGRKWIGIAAAYKDMVRRLIEVWLRRTPEALSAARARHAERLRALAERVKLSEEALHRVHELRRPPMTDGLLRVIRAFQVDRLALLFSLPLVVAAVALTPWPWWPMVVGIIGVALFFAGRVALAEVESTDPRGTMRRVSARIRKIARVPIVVFGHSHTAEAEGEGTDWYFNTGHWAHHGGGESATHVVIERTDKGLAAALCQWTGTTSRVLHRALEPRALGDA